MFINQKVRKRISIIIACAVIWMFLGTLVNFHAHRILGKELIEKAYPSVKPKTKESTYQYADIGKAGFTLDLLIPILAFCLSGLLISFITLKRKELEIPLIITHGSLHHGLRAPPLK